mmetsp:Transcript_28392/g.74218  ORF Transcript_28392/g.74218 Transcript_28392/m.74218 type:complete len:223 (+) Transcript_28392:1015-1683(+)
MRAHFAHLLQRVPETCLFVLHHRDASEAANPDETDACQFAEHDIGVLKIHALYQLRPQIFREHVQKICLIQAPQHGKVAHDRNSCTARLLEKQASVAEAAVLAERTHNPAVDLNFKHSRSHHVERGAQFALLDDAGASGVAPRHERLENELDLLVGEMPEDRNAVREEHILRQLRGVVQAVDGRHAELRKRRYEAALGEGRGLAPGRASAQNPSWPNAALLA